MKHVVVDQGSDVYHLSTGPWYTWTLCGLSAWFDIKEDRPRRLCKACARKVGEESLC